MMTITRQGLGMGNERFESFGVPIFFVDTAITEDAGDGMTRVWNCATRNGVITPQCEIIMRASRLLVVARNVHEAAQGMLTREMRREGVH